MHDYDVNEATEEIVKSIQQLTGEIHAAVVTPAKARKAAKAAKAPR